MVNKFSEVLNQLVQRHGDVYVFAVLQMDDLIDKWSIIMSAPWINTSGAHREIFEETRNLLIEKFTDEELSNIARLGLLSVDEHLIQELLKYNKGTEIKSQKINGNIVHKGFILASDSNPSVEPREV